METRQYRAILRQNVTKRRYVVVCVDAESEEDAREKAGHLSFPEIDWLLMEDGFFHTYGPIEIDYIEEWPRPNAEDNE